ncbi:DUF4880 domain-containing protein [Rhodanobacter sp. FW106-PBR-LB-2-19]|uniref:DUF4880 domain-containing protein n=1 Tax=Rhodanobacter sp. FW106-PBR-LB-2-19 TaxID=2766737 RepID=UPI0034E5E4E9
MAHTPPHADEQLLLAAADWWTRLRDPHGAEATMDQWLDWTAQDERHLAAFEYVSALGERLGTLDAAARRRLLDEFAPAVAPRGPSWLPLPRRRPCWRWRSAPASCCGDGSQAAPARR